MLPLPSARRRGGGGASSFVAANGVTVLFSFFIERLVPFMDKHIPLKVSLV